MNKDFTLWNYNKDKVLIALSFIIYLEVKKMNSNNVNRSIKCSVTQCEHHSDAENYCTLDSIKVGTHEANPTVVECTDCESFIVKS